ncbi:MAG: DUF732 domain-containing protein, partial [Mycobacterium sp.]
MIAVRRIQTSTAAGTLIAAALVVGAPSASADTVAYLVNVTVRPG